MAQNESCCLFHCVSALVTKKGVRLCSQVTNELLGLIFKRRRNKHKVNRRTSAHVYLVKLTKALIQHFSDNNRLAQAGHRVLITDPGRCGLLGLGLAQLRELNMKGLRAFSFCKWFTWDVFCIFVVIGFFILFTVHEWDQYEFQQRKKTYAKKIYLKTQKSTSEHIWWHISVWCSNMCIVV